MVDNAWRDSFVIKTKVRLEREYEDVEREDNSSLLDIERRTNQAKPSGGDGLFAGTSFETSKPAAQATLIREGLKLRTSGNGVTFGENAMEEYQQQANEGQDGDQEEIVGGKKISKRVTIMNRATAALEDFAERLSSGSTVPLRRKGSKDGKDESDREKSMDSPDRRKSTAPQRVKSAVAKLGRAASRKFKHTGEGETDTPEPEPDVTPESLYISENPQYAKGQAQGDSIKE